MDSNRCLKGINIGKLQVAEEKLNLEYQGKEILSLPFNKIQNCQITNKSDINLRLAHNDQQGDCVTELRLYVPQQIEEDDDKDEQEDEKLGYAQKLSNLIIQKANIQNVIGDSLVTLPQIPLVVPRGRYNIDIYNDFIRFHGSTFNNKIENKNIEKAFLLPKIDDQKMVFVLALKQSVRQGNTTYPYILMQFQKDQMVEIKLNIKDEELANYDSKLQSKYDGPLYDTTTKLFKILVGVNIIIPGNFKSSNGSSFVRCSVKANEGHLFFLQKSLIFINKPILYIKQDDIEVVEFHRTSQTMSKFFDLNIKRKAKGSSDITLVGIEKQEKECIIQYFQSRNIRIALIEDQIMNRNIDDQSDDDIDYKRKDDEDSHLNDEESEDESFVADQNDSDDDDDDDDDDE